LANVHIRGWVDPFANGLAYSRMGYIRGWVGTYMYTKRAMTPSGPLPTYLTRKTQHISTTTC
jgi:hypothetical protein